MKYVLILGDGMADYPIDQLGGKTPLECANTPYMDLLSASGKIGLVKTVPDEFAPGSDVANLGALGYDARVCYTGRSPLEALSIGVDMADDDVAIRTNLVTLSDDEIFENKIMLDYSAGEISSEEAKVLIEYVNTHLGSDNFTFYAGTSYRHCLVINHTSAREVLTPPHNISGCKIGTHLPMGAWSDKLVDIIKKSYDLLRDHPINKARVEAGKNPANAVWFWGEGTKPQIESFEARYNKKGAMISAVDLLKGIAIGAKMTSINVEGATGTLKSNFDGKAQAAIGALDGGSDFCMVHLEAPDECGHQGDYLGKVKAIELIDQKIIGAIFEHLTNKGEDFAMLVMPDHYTPISILTHSREPVPFLLYSSKEVLDNSKKTYSEDTAKKSGIFYKNPWILTSELFAL